MRKFLPQVYGYTSGLTKSQLNRLKLLTKRRIPPDMLISPQLGSLLTSLATQDIKREIGVIIDRKGNVLSAIVGSSESLEIPEFDTAYPQVRIIHAHPDSSPLKQDDKAMLTIHNLDCMAVLKRNQHGQLLIDYACLYNNRILESQGFKPLDTIEINLQDIFKYTDILTSQKHYEIQQGETALLVIVTPNAKKAERRLTELQELAKTAGLFVIKTFIQIRLKPDSKTLVGKGKLEEIFLEARKNNVDLIIFDPDFSPAQAKNITSQTNSRVIDRTMLILDIFAQHALTKEAKLQVELAQLKYRLPYLSHKGTMMSRLMGGIGGRGPGESKLEIDRRRVRERIARLENSLKKIQKERSLRRKKRQANKIPVISIVGYTNAGKSTLLTALTGKEVLIEDKLFATLSPRARKMRLPSGISVILTDTVGFIEDLPSDLQQAFKATIEEITESNLILHIIDLSDPNFEFKKFQVEKILTDLNISNIPILEVYNKCDLLDIWPQGNGVYVSGLTRKGLDNLREAITNWLLLDRDI